MLILLILTVFVSGCVNGDPDIGDRSIEVVSFESSDNEIVPEQQTEIELVLENYQQTPIEIKNTSLFNYQPLDKDNRGCTPGQEISAATEGAVSQMNCNWVVEADQESIDGYTEGRNVPVSLELLYNSVLENEQPYQLQIKPVEDVESTERESMSFTNNEIRMDIEMRQPVSDSTEADITVINIGDGRIDSNYTVSFENEMFSDCEGEKESFTGQDVDYRCEVQVEDDSERVENVFFSTSYKYLQTTSTNIEVVDR